MEKKLYYFDMHSHILPDIDDGAGTLEETLKMLDMAYEEGIRYICATPHYNHDHPLDLRKVFDACKMTEEMLRQRHPDMKVFLGNEMMWSYSVMEDLEHQKILTYNGSRYILVEFYPTESYNTIFYALQSLTRNRYMPVIAHMERLDCLWKRWERLDELKTMHILFQMNTSSIIGSYLNGSVRYCRKLISEGYIDLLGTDAHHCTGRTPVYRMAADWIEKTCGRAYLKKIAYENPSAVLSGRRI